MLGTVDGFNDANNINSIKLDSNKVHSKRIKNANFSFIVTLFFLYRYFTFANLLQNLENVRITRFLSLNSNYL